MRCEIFGKSKKVVFYALGGHDFTSFDELEGVDKDVYFRFIYSKSVAMEAFGFHQAIEFFDHEGVVNWSDQFDVPVMPWAIVGGKTTSWTASIFVKRGDAHSLVVETMG